jgi:hypothetical protein
MINLPSKDSGIEICGSVETDSSGNVTNYRIEHNTLSGWLIINIPANDSHQIIADNIAAAITEARDAGFEQGRKHVREALGICQP